MNAQKKFHEQNLRVRREASIVELKEQRLGVLF